MPLLPGITPAHAKVNKPPLGTAGRSLTGVESNRGAVVTWTAGVCGGAAALAAVFVTFTGRGWRIAVFVLAAIAACALLVLIGSAFRPAWGWLEETRRQRQQRKGQPSRVITDRWRYTSAAFEVGTLANLGQRGFSHDQYLRSAEDKPPAVRFGVFVACRLLPDDEPTAEHLRSCMRDCLAQPKFMGLIGKLIGVDVAAAWHSQPGRGRFNLEADLVGLPGSGKVFASALLLLPERGVMRDGKDSAGAELYLHVDLPMEDSVPVRAGLAEWHDRFIAALELPGLLSRFLDSVGLAVSGDPAARFAIYLRARGLATIGLDEIVDFGDLAVLQPRRYSVQFDGWAVADEQGKAAGAVSRRFLTELCENTGRTGYEGVLTDLADAEGPIADLQPSHSLKGSRAARIGSLGVIAALVMAAGIGFWVSASSRTAASTGTITDPSNGTPNAQEGQLHVSGTAQNIPSGYRLDVVLQFAGQPRYFMAADPNVAAPLINGHWSATIDVGDSGSIILYLVSLSPAEVELVNHEVHDQTNGYPTLPGARLASVSLSATISQQPSTTSCGDLKLALKGQQVVCDNLNPPRYNWSDPNGSGHSQYVQDGYKVNSPDGSVQVGVPTNAPLNLGRSSALNVVVAAFASASTGSTGQFGLVCRGGGHEYGLQGKGYGFAIQGNVAVIDKFEFKDNGTSRQQLAESRPLKLINNGRNVLQASCFTLADSGGVQLIFWVNGKEAAHDIDKNEPFGGGYVGVYTYLGASAIYRDFSVYRP
jgi:hypothetical protein